MNLKQRIIIYVTAVWVTGSIIQGLLYFPKGPKGAGLLAKQLAYSREAVLPIGIPLLLCLILIRLFRSKDH